MKLCKILMALFIATFACANAIGQSNASISVLTQNGGQVTQGGNVFIQVTVNSTGPTTGISTYRVRAQISVPSPLVSIAPNAQQTGLPANWTIVTNTGTSITVCNATDAIPVGQSRTILIRVIGGPTLGGPSPVSGTLTFGNGLAGNGCTTLTGSLPGDNSADNTSSSSVQVIAAPTCELTGVSASAGTIACNGGTTTLTATQTGASGAVEYSLNGGAFQSSNTFTVNAAGSPYTVTAREVATPACVVTSSAVTVTEPASITASAAAGAIACNGGSTTLTVTASGGTGTLEYSLNGGAFQSGNTFSVNAAGSPYTVTVRDANTCTATTNTVTLSEPSAITASAAAGTIACNGGSTTLTVTASGGTGALEYSLNGGAFQSANTFTVNAAGSPYTVMVRDANACIATTNTVTVTQPTLLTATATSTPVTTTGGSDGTATAVPAGGTPGYTYSWNTTPVQTTISATGLTAGNYTVTVTDANGCSTTANATVGSPSCTLGVTASAGTIACNGGTTTLTATASGASGSVEYSITGGAPFQAGNTFTVGAGTYTVTVREVSNPTCIATSSVVTITEPAILVAASSAPAIALPGGSTTVTVTASGGTTPYTGTGTFTRAAGTYTFTVTDANGCTDDTEITLVDPTPGPANAFIGVVTLNAGQVVINQTVDVQVSVGNSGPGFIGSNTVRAQINVPSAIATILPTAQQTGIPAGWSIIDNTGSSITICNGTDLIPTGEQRQVLVRIQGTSIGGPSAITGELTFGPGTAGCTGTASLPGDNGSDNTSSSNLQVTATLPVTLIDFTAKLVNCKPTLHWITQNEVEFDHFEIERSAAGSINWITVATVQARGNNNGTRLEYNFTDANLNSSSDQVIYRLKLVDRDGRYKYSSILRVYVNCEITQAFVYPNPVEDGRLYVSLTGAGKNSEARLVSLSGQVVAKARMSVGTNSINVSKVAAGTYILVVTDEKGFEKKFKVFIQN